MTVIPFPSRARRDATEDAASPLAAVVAAICVLGEPARLEEISDLVQTIFDRPTLDADTAVLSALQAHCVGLAPVQMALFRAVGLQGGEAWALTSDFRAALRTIGVASELRAPGA